MGNKNFRNPALSAPKATTITISKVPNAAARTSTKNHPTPATKLFIKVNVCSHDGRDIKSGVDITALRRFSKEARFQIPASNTTTDPAEASVDFKLPEYIGYSMVTDQAVIDVCEFLEDHKRDKDLPRFTKQSLASQDFVHLLNAYAFVRCLGVPFSPFPLEKQICEIIRTRPITAIELAACWELLDDSHECIITTAVQSLTYFYRTYKIDHDHNAALEDYIRRDVELKGMFIAEDTRQTRISRNRDRTAKGRAQESSNDGSMQ